MDALLVEHRRCIVRRTLASLLGGWLIFVATSAGAVGVATQHFLVDAATPEMAKAVATAAEKYRHELAMHWLGQPLPPWSGKCRISVRAGNYPAQGVTTYQQAPVRDFNMEVIGTPQRIMDSVLPHEITHTVLASHFGRPIPRWADEGICTTVEHPDEKNKHEVKLREFLNTRRGIAMNKLFLLTEYPPDILPMYAQGYSVVRFLIEQKDARTFVEFLGDYMDMQRPSWTQNIRKHYGYESLGELQEHWVAWVASGSGPVDKYVKATQPNRPTDASIAQASAAGASAAGASADPPSIRLAATDSATAVHGQNWYSRNRDRTADEPKDAARNDTAPKIAAAAPSTARGATPLSLAAAAGGPGATAVDSINAPPSVQSRSTYSSAHPQPEQRMARGGRPIDDPRRPQASDQPQASGRPRDSGRSRYDSAAVRYWR